MRDGAKVREFWSEVDAGGSFDIKGTPYWHALSQFHFASGKSTHQDRLMTIRELREERRETVRSPVYCARGRLRGRFPSTRGPGITNLLCASCPTKGTAG